jgi:hypothetical protein
MMQIDSSRHISAKYFRYYKPKERLDYLASQKNFRNADVIVFEEAWDRDLRGELKAFLLFNKL